MNDELSNILEKLNIDQSPDMINNLMDMLNNNSNSQSNIDFDTIIRMKTIIDKINTKDDPRAKLLESLKPYLKESRKNKVDQYVQLMNMSKVFESFNLFNGDNKNAFR